VAIGCAPPVELLALAEPDAPDAAAEAPLEAAEPTAEAALDTSDVTDEVAEEARDAEAAALELALATVPPTAVYRVVVPIVLCKVEDPEVIVFTTASVVIAVEEAPVPEAPVPDVPVPCGPSARLLI
jgi:hypothetical protein